MSANAIKTIKHVGGNFWCVQQGTKKLTDRKGKLIRDEDTGKPIRVPWIQFIGTENKCKLYKAGAHIPEMRRVTAQAINVAPEADPDSSITAD